MSRAKKVALGRGLSALLNPENEGPHNENDEQESGKNLMTLAISAIEPGQNQPRVHFSKEELESLSLSIQERGVLQPILVRPHPTQDGKYEIVAGERRWRASKIAGLDFIPVIVNDLTDSETLEVALLENIQRQDLNPIEEANGYRRLAEEFNYTQEALSQALGKSRSHIANCLRLLNLPKKVKVYLEQGKLSPGHARTLIGADDPEGLAKKIVNENFTVREAEDLAKQKQTSGERFSAPRLPDPEKEILRDHLSNLLGVSVDLVLKGLGGKVVIPFKSPVELDILIQKLNDKKGSE